MDLNIGECGWLEGEVEMSKEHIKNLHLAMMDQLTIDEAPRGWKGGGQWDLIRI